MGATQASNNTGKMGLNVLLHGDGGQSFFDFPNQAVQGNLMGVVALAPNKQRFWGGGSGLQRTDGVAHAAAVNSMIQDVCMIILSSHMSYNSQSITLAVHTSNDIQVLPKLVAFDKSKVFFTGVSGGSLLLSGFFVPAFISQYNTGAEFNCGGLTPQVNFVDSAATLSRTRIHFQSTQAELAELQPELPKSIKAYEQLATQGGMNAQQVGTLQTVDNSPNGGYWCVSNFQVFARCITKI